ncbi:MAG: hypothetical protein E3J54_02700 [Actinobacteria bacterium]|nr:MAG: hypothetical protein E3J54_02700 [Actinomycetota bacterium]
MASDKEILAKLTKQFISETKIRLENVKNRLTCLEKKPCDAKAIEELHREAHTIKGSSRIFGFPEIGEIAYQNECILAKIKNGRIKATKQIVDLLLSSFNVIGLLLENNTATADKIDLNSLHKKLERNII